MSQKDQETSYELEMVISQSGKVLGHQALLFKDEEVSAPPESSDSFPVELTAHEPNLSWADRVKLYGYCDMDDCYCDGAGHPDTPEPPLRGIRKALRFFRSP